MRKAILQFLAVTISRLFGVRVMIHQDLADGKPEEQMMATPVDNFLRLIDTYSARDLQVILYVTIMTTSKRDEYLTINKIADKLGYTYSTTVDAIKRAYEKEPDVIKVTYAKLLELDGLN